tara:strand:- start:58 stop:783 length:726 start_codon:yes stop_codon:yes gene_type:complete
MKKNFFLIALSIIVSNKLNSQNSKNFAYLFSGEKIYSNNVEYITGNFSKSYFLLGDKKIENKNVKFYKNSSGFFGNTSMLDFIGRMGFAKREVKGNINLFKEETVSNTMIMGGNGMMTSMGPNYFVDYYYNLDEFGDLKKANYKNLNTDLSSNPNSMFHLKKFKSVNQRKTILYIVGGIVVASGVASLINKTSNIPPGEETPSMTGSAVIIGIGFGTLVTNYLTTRNRHKHVVKAIEEFNK